MNDAAVRERFHAAADIAVLAGRELAARFRRELSIGFKGRSDPVTDADIASERLIRDRIAALFPGDFVLAEEFHDGGEPGDEFWSVDPLDGTVNYSHGLPWYAVSIGWVSGGEPVFGVVYAPEFGWLFAAMRGEGARLNGRPLKVSGTSDLSRALVASGFHYDRAATRENFAEHEAVLLAVQDIRRTGCASLDICFLAKGAFDAYYEFGLGPWDFTAGWVIAEEAGARIATPRGGRPHVLGREFLAASPSLLEPLVAIISKAGEEHA